MRGIQHAFNKLVIPICFRPPQIYKRVPTLQLIYFSALSIFALTIAFRLSGIGTGSRTSLQQRIQPMSAALMRYSRHVRVLSPLGSCTLRLSTIEKHLPRFLHMLELHIGGQSNPRDGIRFDISRYPSRAIERLCLAYVFEHLRQVELSGGTSSYLLEWLERLWDQALGSRSYRPGRYDVTEVFTALGKIFDDRAFGCHGNVHT